ncbi:NAD(P)-binding protein [Punctularia strigosozonata HHB-11173 SS5]|uniref:NAD(P)-binding protein n=1 Tax=Punctularia strigosozonata (strain HHB-11173) TaxID=741275 RepID=UPI0004417B8C|nr:NAD(P)-binding protein [Punctularia strigosozonata HHB-11173 SS5]EIN11466.1 NAD(P)-binding protein [Punctularia strigosozonata HHB-11173 SS5]
MTTVSDKELLAYVSRAKGKVVIVTGGGNGIGRASALQFARHGAKVVLGDLDLKAAEECVKLCAQAGGEAAVLPAPCDVTSWDDQVALFEFALRTYGQVDIVVPNAGITDGKPFAEPTLAPSAKYGHDVPVEPSTTVLDVNLKAVLHTVHLAIHYLKLNSTNDANELKAIVLVCSMASWNGIPGAVLYSTSKHALLGTLRSLHAQVSAYGIRLVGVCPWFVDTGILPPAMKVLMAGLPWAPLDRVANAIFYSSTDPSAETSGATYLIPDDGPVLRVEKERITAGIYAVLDRRLSRAVG